MFSFYQGHCKPKTAFQVVASGLRVGSEPYFRILGAHAVILQLGLPEGICKFFVTKYFQNHWVYWIIRPDWEHSSHCNLDLPFGEPPLKPGSSLNLQITGKWVRAACPKIVHVASKPEEGHQAFNSFFEVSGISWGILFLTLIFIYLFSLGKLKNWLAKKFVRYSKILEGLAQRKIQHVYKRRKKVVLVWAALTNTI